MSKKRMIDTRIWHDSWFRTLSALEQHLFMYLITNDKCSFCGIYELPLSTIAYEASLDEREIKEKMLPKLEPKVFYREGWVCLTNFKKHHVSEGSKNSLLGYTNALKEVPPRISAIFDVINKPIEAPCKPLTSPSDTIAIASAIASISDSDESGKKKLIPSPMFNYQPIDESGNPIRRKNTNAKAVRERNAEYIQIGFKFEKLGEQCTGVKPDLTKAYFIIKNAREKHGVDDFNELFTYFFNDQTLTLEQKVSLAFVCSPAYITKWKVSKKNHVVSQIEASADIRL